MLHEMIVDKNIVGAMQLLKSGEHVSEGDLQKSMELSCMHHYIDLVLEITKKDYRKRANCSEAVPAIQCSIEHGHPDLIDILTDSGYELNEFIDGRIPLHYITELICDMSSNSIEIDPRYIESIVVMIRKDADTSARDYNGFTPAEYAERRGLEWLSTMLRTRNSD